MLDGNQTSILVDHVYRDYRVSKKTGFMRKKGIIIKALADVSLEIKEGEIFGLVGCNGAGKTTLIKIIATLLYPTKGRVTVSGFDVVKESNEVRKIVNMVAGAERMLHYRLTGRENLLYYAELYDVPRSFVKPRVTELLELVDMTDQADIPVERYSKGQRQRIQIARGLINDPKILLLDEPTLGLDVEVARDIRSLVVRRVKEEKLTVLLTSHYLFEVDEMVNRLAVIDSGKIVTVDTPPDLKKKMNLRQSVSFVIDPLEKDQAELVRKIPGVLDVRLSTPREVTAGGDCTQQLTVISDLNADIPRLIKELGTMTTIRHLNISQGTLEEAFLKIVNKEKEVA